MARKERNNVDYFPHSVLHGRKMFYLRSKYKNDGYAVWFMLLEHIGKAEYHYLDLSDRIQVMYLSSEFMVSEDLLIEIVDTLVSFEEFDFEMWECFRILFNQKFIENIQDAYKKRNNNCIDKNSLLILLSSKGLLKGSLGTPFGDKYTSEVSDNTHSKLYYSKVEESIVDKTKVLLSDAPDGAQTKTPKNIWISTFDERKENFKKSLFPFTNHPPKLTGPYQKSMLLEFFEYWIEPNKSRSRMRWELEKTWDLAKRLANWSKNDRADSREKNINLSTVYVPAKKGTNDQTIDPAYQKNQQ